MLTGRRFGGGDALAAGIVSDALPEDGLLPAATEWARSQSGKAGPTLRTIRTTMYRHVIDQLGPGTVLQLPT
jgi:enoyl-CoA hydratase/carnithine racemase